MSDPVFEMYVNGSKVAERFEPQFEEMFWFSYRVVAGTEVGDAIVHDLETWQAVNFEIRDKEGFTPNPATFASGSLQAFCDRQTDRLLFRSLYPPPELEKPNILKRLLFFWKK